MSAHAENEILNETQIAEALAGLSGWELQDGALQKKFACNSFLEAIAFVNRVAVVSETLDHHPDFNIDYKRVTLRCWTHRKNAITQADLALAQGIESVA